VFRLVAEKLSSCDRWSLPASVRDAWLYFVTRRAMLPVARAMVRQALRIVAGTHTGYSARSNRRMVGRRTMDAIKAGTAVAAESIGVEKRIASPYCTFSLIF
jgi:imidazolonepropionase-like amidohydrolase